MMGSVSVKVFAKELTVAALVGAVAWFCATVNVHADPDGGVGNDHVFALRYSGLKGNQHAQVYWDQLKKHAGVERPSEVENGFVFSVDQILQFRDEIYRNAEKNRSAVPLAIAGRAWQLSGILSP